MRLELTGRHVEITPTLRRLVDAKLAKLERMLRDSAVSAQAVLTREKYRHRVEITLHARGEKFLHGLGNTGAWESSVSQAIEKITQQAQRVKGKWQERKRQGPVKGVPIAGEAPEAVSVAPAAPRPRAGRVRMPRILHAERQAVKTMTVADAARQIDGHADTIVVFRDAETSAVSVLYRRRDGELTLVATEA
ncbi:MAG TPA: ribosome-associated translation inhibitor RaiA [Vicinamibacterales bacterium]|nr:ribosome-associated translation inhibitor RaiA [Vicinamibacterales bacterium]